MLGRRAVVQRAADGEAPVRRVRADRGVAARDRRELVRLDRQRARDGCATADGAAAALAVERPLVAVTVHLERAAVLPAAVERARDHLAVDVTGVAIDDDLGEGCENRRPKLPAVLTRDESRLAAPSEDGERAAVVLALGRAEEGSVVRERIVALVDDLDAVAVAVDVDGVEREPLVVGPLEGDRVW